MTHGKWRLGEYIKYKRPVKWHITRKAPNARILERPHNFGFIENATTCMKSTCLSTKLHAFFILVLHEGERSASYSSHFTPGKIAPCYTMDIMPGEAQPVWMCWQREKSLSLPYWKSNLTDWDISASLKYCKHYLAYWTIQLGSYDRKLNSETSDLAKP